ncbi:hypothetical protein ACFQ0B_45245 [Nonomuraea thailandensis]
MDRDKMAENGEAHSLAPATEIPQLLEMYNRALDDAAALPIFFVKIPCRASRWRLLKRLAVLPRLTLGTHTLLVRHIDRNLATIIRHQSVKGALGHLTEAQARDRDSCTAFRNSLPPARLALVVIGVAVSATIIALLLSSIPKRLFARAFPGEGFDRAFQAVAAELLDLATGGGGGDLMNALGGAMKLGVQGVLALLSVMLITSYLIARPLVSAFRIKRQILCLADQDVLDVKDTASSWYVNKSTGAYTQERKVSAVLGLRRTPTERPLDLAILSFPALCALLLTAAYAWITGRRLVEDYLAQKPSFDDSWFLAFFPIPCLFIWLASLWLLRFKWLHNTWRGRQGTTPAPPLVYATSSGDYVESRPIAEAVAWPLASGPVFFTLLTYPLVGAVHFHRLVLTGIVCALKRRVGRDDPIAKGIRCWQPRPSYRSSLRQ